MDISDIEDKQTVQKVCSTLINAIKDIRRYSFGTLLKNLCSSFLTVNG